MSFDPLAQLTGRDSEIAAFTLLVSPGQGRWILLVDGFSGTGKTLLVEWLRYNACAGIANAKLTLSKSWSELDLLASIIAQVAPEQSDRYLAAMRRLDESDRRQPLVQFSNVMEAHGGTIREASQNIDLDLGHLAAMTQIERRARRLDVCFEHMAVLRSQTWVLFLDEAEHIRQPDLSRFLLQELVPRLRSRFGGFRLYVTGQSVPREHFAAHEREELTLGTLSRVATLELLVKTGLTDPGLARRVFDVTLGHPLLLGMLIEDLLASGDDLEAEELMGTLTDLDELQRTQWIYDRVVARFEDPTARELAANLSLFEWFDLSLARAVFGPHVSESTFQEMVSRSFIKYLESGRLQCHEIIRRNLRPHREHLDPIGCREIRQKAFRAYTARIVAEEERIGERWFRDRVYYFTAAMDSALGYSAEEALRFARVEIVCAIEKFVADYLYGLIRFITSREISEPLKILALRTKAFIEEVNLRQFSSTSPEFLEELVDHAVTTGAPTRIESILRAASHISLRLGQIERAERLAQRAIEISGSARDHALLSDVLVRGGNFEGALRVLSEACSRLGNPPDLILAEARVHLVLQNIKAASELFAEVIATVPDDCSEARLQLASLLMQQGDLESALAQVEALLRDDPDHPEACALRADLLISLGRISEGIDQVSKVSKFSQTINAEQWLRLLFSDQIAQRRVLTDLEHAPEDVPFLAAMGLLNCIAAKGDLKGLESVTFIVERRWPETRELNQITKAEALLQAQHFADAERVISPLIASNTHHWQAYFIAAQALGGLGERRREREALRRAGEKFSFLHDLATSGIAVSYTREERPDLALQWLEAERSQRGLGPLAEKMRAQLLADRGELRAALEICEELIHTTDRDNLPDLFLIDLRLIYARFLLKAGENQRAHSVADQILTSFEGQPRAASAVLEIFFTLQHEEGLIKLLDCKTLTPIERLSLVGILAETRVNQGSSLDSLLEELDRNPKRIDLIAAVDALATQNPELLGYAAGRIVEIAPEAFQELNSLRGEALTKDSNILQQIRIALANDPNVPNYHIGLVNCLFSQGHIEEGRAECAEIRRRFPSLREFSLGLEASALLEIGQVAAADEILAPYLNFEPPPEQLLGALVLFLEKTKDRNREITLHRRVAASYPALRQVALVRLVESYDESDAEQTQQALAVIAEIEAEAPLSPQLLLRRAYLLHRLGRSDEALALARELRESDAAADLRGEVHGLTAEILEQLGELQDSASAYFRALESEPFMPSFHLGVSRVHECLGDLEVAFLALKEAVALAPALLHQHEEKLRELHKLRRNPAETSTLPRGAPSPPGS